MAHDNEKYPTATQQENPSHPDKDPVHPTWVEASGYEPAPEDSADHGTWNEQYKSEVKNLKKTKKT